MLLLKRTLSIDVEVSKKSSGRVEGAWGVCDPRCAASPHRRGMSQGPRCVYGRVSVLLGWLLLKVLLTDKSIMARSVEFL